MWGIRQWVANCGVAYHLPGNMLNPTSAKQKTMEFKAAWADATGHTSHSVNSASQRSMRDKQKFDRWFEW